MRTSTLLGKVWFASCFGQPSPFLLYGRFIRISRTMIEVLRTNDPVKLSFALSILRDAGCHPFEADSFTASVEGSISAIPRRILVPHEEEQLARRVLADLYE